MKATSDTYAHRLVGDCHCGVRHDPAPPDPQPGGNVQQALSVFKAGGEVVDGLDDQLKIGALFAQSLSPLGVVPNTRLLQFALNFGQSLTTLIVVKDTP